MKLLTALSGTLLAAAGAFCFKYISNSFTGVAFILGLTMIISGFLDLIAYLASGRKDRLPDTVLVEGIVNLVMGFAVVNDQVLDSMVMMFFGIWILVSGVTRFSQSFAVSRINPKHWFAVIPLSIVDTILGLVMIMPSLISGVDALFLTAAAFVLNGFSLIIYAMNMKKKVLGQKELEAAQRAHARQLQEKENREKRDALRKMSKDEREAARRAEREREDRIEAARQAKKAAEKAERRAEKKLSDTQTLQLSTEEVAQINAAAEGSALPEPEAEPKETPKSFDELWEMTGVELIKEEPKEPEIPEETEEIQTKAHWNKPTDIPSLRANVLSEEKEEEPLVLRIDTLNIEKKRAIVNLEEIEDSQPEVNFDKVELPEVEIMSEGGESRRRQAILSALEDTEIAKADDDLTSFKPLTVEELFADEQFHIKPLSDPKATATDLKFTQTFKFDRFEK